MGCRPGRPDHRRSDAAHTQVLGEGRQLVEPLGWCEKLLPAAIAADLASLARLYTAASMCCVAGRAEDAVGYAQAAAVLETDPRYLPFALGQTASREVIAHLFAGRPERCLEISTSLAAQTGLAHVAGLCGRTISLLSVGRADEAIAIADETMTAAHAHGGPYHISWAYHAAIRAYARTDPVRALDIARQGLTYTRQHRHHRP